MTVPIVVGGLYQITRDIPSSGEPYFHKGDMVRVETTVDELPDYPGAIYVVRSSVTGKSHRLGQDAFVLPVSEATQPPPLAQPPTDPKRGFPTRPPGGATPPPQVPPTRPPIGYTQQEPKTRQAVLGVLAIVFAAVGMVMVIASLETLIIGLVLSIAGLILGIIYLVKSPKKAVGIVAVVIAALALPLAPITCAVHVVEEVSEELEETDKTPVKGVVGEALKSGDLSIIVHGFQASPGDEMFTPKAGNQYIVVDLEVNNNSKETEAVSTMMQMSIKTPEGYGYDQAMYFPEPKYPDGNILAGQKARGNVAFEVPADVGAMSFVFASMFGDPVEVKLQ